MIKPNFELMLWFWLIYMLVAGSIYTVIAIVRYGEEKKNNIWNLVDIIVGLIYLIVGLAVLIL